MAEVTKWRQYWWIWPWFVFIAITVAAYLAPPPYKVVVPDKLELIAQLRAGEYQALEDYLTNLQDHFETGDVPERNVSIGFNAFGNSGRDVEGHLNDWVKQLPQSYAARMARGAYYWNLGWLARTVPMGKEKNSNWPQRMTRLFKLARADLEHAIAKKPRLTTGYALLISITIAEDNRAERRELMRRSLSDNPVSRWILSTFMTGLQPERGGSLQELDGFMTEVVREKKNHPGMPKLEWHLYKARAYGFARARKYQKAIDAISEGILLFEARELYVTRGWYYQMLGKHREAVKDFTRAIELYPQYRYYLWLRARSYYVMNLGEHALADLNLALRLDPLEPNALHLRARMYRSQNKNLEALQDLNDAMEYGRDDVNIWRTRAELYRRGLKDPSKALADMSQITRLEPDNLHNWMQFQDAVMDFGKELYRQKKDCDAAALFTRFLEACRVNRSCQRGVYATAALMLGGAVAETNCPGKTSP